MDKVRWGIVSTGRMSDWFCSDFGSVPNGELTAVCSRSESSAREFAAKYQMKHAVSSIADLLALDIDIVYIATPHTKHKAIALECLKAGKPVLCEKPIVTKVTDAEELISAARQSDTFLAEAMWTWHLPALIKAKQWVNEGRIGKLVHVKTDFGYPVPYSPDQREYDANDAGGALREMGIYPIAISRFFINRSPDRVMVAHQPAPNGVEQDLTAIFEFGDMTSTLATSYRCRMGNAAYIVGEEGYIIIPNAFRADRASLFKIDDEIETFAAERTERGYHYQAINIGNDVMKGSKESSVAPLSASLSLQQDIKQILDATGRGEA